MTRFRFLRDDSTHWYLVPEADVAHFQKALEYIASLDPDSDEYYANCAKFENTFDELRCSAPERFTFTDPKETP